ncbi:hypothetical protein BD626DRAFT_523645, partial [Schizophyllum amplum]
MLHGHKQQRPGGGSSVACIDAIDVTCSCNHFPRLITSWEDRVTNAPPYEENQRRTATRRHESP